MNGSKSPDPKTRSPGPADTAVSDAPAVLDGHLSPGAFKDKPKAQSSPVHSIEGGGDKPQDAPAEKTLAAHVFGNTGDDDAASEAETLIDSPVKRRELEKQLQNSATKADKPQRSRIGGLPVPQDDDEDMDSATSPIASTERSPEKRADATIEGKEVQPKDEEDDRQAGSEPLSSAQSPIEGSLSRDSSTSRSKSERSREEADGEGSPNPRKRKHRASSASLPSSKRQSMDPPKRRLRGMHSEGFDGRSPSPTGREHKRAFSTQSGIDGNIEVLSRKRKAASQFPVRDGKASRHGLEESDASSETTSRGNDEQTRPKRGIGRATSTPGRPQPQLKRHVNKYGFTKLAEACENNDLDLVKQWRQKDPDQLEQPEFAMNTPLQIAALNGNGEIVSYLIDQGCQIDCANVDKDTPLIDAAENGHSEVVKLLLDAGVDPLRQNSKGQQALDVITDETEEVGAIRAALHGAIDAWNSSEAKQRREEEEEQRHRAGPSKGLQFMARTYENLLKLVRDNDRNGVREFLAARVPVDNNIIAAAAKTGDSYLVNMLLAEMTDKKAWQKPEKPMLSVLGTSHFEMVKMITELDQFNPLWKSRQGRTWPELAEDRAGSMWKQEKDLLQKLYDQRMAARTSSSPVSKREHAKRKAPPNPSSRPSQHDGSEGGRDDGSDEDVVPAKRKIARRLMSKKDMRRAGGKATLDDSSEDDAKEGTSTPVPASENDAEPRPSDDSGPRPPETSRANSPQQVSKPPSPAERKPDPTKAFDKESEAAAAQKLKAEKEEEAKYAIEQASRLEAKRREEAAAEAEAKRAEEEARKAQEAREEEARREKEEALERERVEAARQAEEEQRRREESAQAARTHRASLLTALPAPLRHFLDSSSPLQYQSAHEKRNLLRLFTPLRCFCLDDPDLPGRWVMNFQIAPLIGKSGIELFFPRDCPGWESSLASEIACIEQVPAELQRSLAKHFVANLHERLPHPQPNAHGTDDSWEAEQARARSRMTALEASRKALLGPTSALQLRAVRLDDLRPHFHPLLRETPVAIEHVVLPSSASEDAASPAMNGKVPSFVHTVAEAWRRNRARFAPETLEQEAKDREAGWVVVGQKPVVRTEEVVVVHEK